MGWHWIMRFFYVNGRMKGGGSVDMLASLHGIHFLLLIYDYVWFM